ncbi:MAG: outer membrane lipoprotein chaperone LolA [Gammaproteobacteria bacterium]|nr:outer membrane lipoprotein chaperone LolA [Gammaproteobacteria bacterium]MCP5135306.1 outer membrane lipoprotein chaperone LolA [Gammaproteobacteria bacterium]
MRLISPVLAALLLFVSPVHADPLSKFLDGLKTYSASFEQIATDAGGQETERSEGTLSIQRPGHFRWEYIKPYPQLIVADGAELYLYDPDLEQVTIKAMDESLSRTPALLLTGDEPLGNNFVVGASETYDGLLWVDLRPKADGTDSKGDFDTIWIGFDAHGDLAAMKIIDGFGQTTRLYFHDGVRDAALPASAFVFVPPPGTDVIRTPRQE